MAETWRLKATLAGHGAGVVHAVSFSSDGKLLASCGDDKTVRLWDGATGAAVAVMEGHLGPVTTICFRPGTRQLFSGGHRGELLVWDTDTRRAIKASQQPGATDHAAYSPDGKRLAFTGTRKSIKLVDGETFGLTRLVEGFPQPPRVVAFVPGADRVAVGCGGAWNENDGTGSLRLIDVKSGKTVRQFRTEAGRFGGIYGLAVSPDGSMIASSSVDHSIHLWDVENGAQLALRTDHRGPSVWVGFAPDGKALASCSFDGDLKVRDAGTGEVKQTLACGYRLDRGAFSPDGRLLAASGHERPVVALWERGNS